MRRLVLAFALAATAIVPSTVPALAMSDLLVRESKLGVKETMDALAAALEAKGLKIAARIDHAAAAKAAGMELRPTEVVMFGNPKLGTPLMQSNPEIAIDLPLKAVAWQAADGKVYFGYTAPDKLKERHHIKDRDEVFKAMAAALLAFGEAATGSGK
jgi:uncharacterized protein (DUF302 family)